MTSRVIRVPDIGEGIAEVELVAWHVAIGDLVREDDVLAEVMTDKATVEVPTPVAGRIIALGGEAGSVLAVGAELLQLDVEGGGEAAARPAPVAKPAPKAEAPAPAKAAVAAPQPPPTPLRAASEKPIASPAVRQRARDHGVDLRQLRGTGPGRRIRHEDIDAYLQGERAVAKPAVNTNIERIPVAGLRRRIAQRMAEAKRRIPHFSYVEEVDVTALEDLRASMNGERADKLTLLPFLMRAVVRAIADFPQMNALYDDEAEIIERHGGVHLGIATQTDAGLMVPVVRHAEARSLRECAAEVRRLAEAARQGLATREELGGSTITITSLGALGGIVSTPVINRPEVAIIAVNRIAVRPTWQGGSFVPRKMMNLSSSFDHRVIDGHDAARFIQRIKGLLEVPTLIFMEA